MQRSCVQQYTAQWSLSHERIRRQTTQLHVAIKEFAWSLWFNHTVWDPEIGFVGPLPHSFLIVLSERFFFRSITSRLQEWSRVEVRTHRLLRLNLTCTCFVSTVYDGDKIRPATFPARSHLFGFIIDWCCFYYFVRNSLVALLEALCAQLVCPHTPQERTLSWSQERMVHASDLLQAQRNAHKYLAVHANKRSRREYLVHFKKTKRIQQHPHKILGSKIPLRADEDLSNNDVPVCKQIKIEFVLYN